MRTSLKNIIYNGIATNAMFSFSGGQILIAYALFFGAGPVLVGLLGSIEFISNFIYLISAYLIYKGKSVKKTSILFSFISRPFYLIMALLIFLPKNEWTLYILVISVFCAYGLSAITGGSFYPWLKELIPQRIMSSFFAERYKWMMIANMVSLGVSGGCMFLFERYFPEHIQFSYAILMSLAFICGMIGVLTLTNIKDVKFRTDKEKSFSKSMINALKYKHFVFFYLFMIIINFSTSFVTPFLTMFMLKENNIGMSLIILFTLVSQISYVLSTKYWSRFAKNKGYFQILETGCIGYICVILSFIMTMKLPTAFVLVILFISHIILGFAMFAIKLGTNNLPLIYVPQKNSFIYLTIISIFKAVGSFSAGLTSGIILMCLQKFIPDNFVVWFSFLFLSMCLFVIAVVFSEYVKRCKHKKIRKIKYL